MTSVALQGTRLAHRAHRVIGISGYARSGKDTVASLLAEGGWHRIAFADALKHSLYVLNPTIVTESGPRPLAEVIDEIGWDVAKVRYPEVRVLQQRMGTEVGQFIFGKGVWVDLLYRGTLEIVGADLLDPHASARTPLVVPDVRFGHEVASVRERNGLLILVDRPGVGPANGHSSEVLPLAREEYDIVITNDSSRDDLLDAVGQLVQHFIDPLGVTYVDLTAGAVARTLGRGDCINVDLGVDGRPVGVEFLVSADRVDAAMLAQASQGMDPDVASLLAERLGQQAATAAAWSVSMGLR